MLSVIVMCLVAMKRGFHSRVVGILLALFCVASIGLVVTSLRIVMLLARRNMSGDIYLYLSSTGLLTWVFFSVVMVILVVLAAMFSRIPGCGMVGVSTGAAIGYYALPVIQGFPGGANVLPWPGGLHRERAGVGLDGGRTDGWRYRRG